MRRTTALIAGGGPAGLTAAITLARGGAEPLVIERHAKTPDLLCGGFISWQTLNTLARLGLDPERLNGHAIDKLRLFSGNRSRDAQLPHPGMGLSRYRLDSLLLEQAELAGAEVQRGVAISSADSPEAIRLANDEEISTDALFLAT